MPEQYAAFISYARQYESWVSVLQSNLEACLAEAGASPSEVFRDGTDLVSGRSWVAQFQEALTKAQHLILVATPESLASPRVEDEWESFLTLYRDWAHGRLHVVLLVDTPLPPFLDRVQRLDFVDHDDSQYRSELQKLAGGLLGRSARDLPELPQGIEIAQGPGNVLPTELRSRLVNWLAPQVERKVTRTSVAAALGQQRASLVGYPTSALTASVAIVLATGDDDRVKAAQRIVASLREEFDEEHGAALAELDQLSAALKRLRASGEGGLLVTWLKKVHRDHSNLVPFFEHADLELLDRVYVQLEFRPEQRVLGERELSGPLREGRTPTLRDLLTLDREKYSWVTQRWVVRGDPGSGKTTLLRHLAAKLAEEKDRNWVPVFESLPRLMEKDGLLLDRIEKQLHKVVAVQGLAAALGREGQEGRLLLLLDGLDEVPKEDRPEAEALLRHLSVSWPKTPLVVTSRPIGYQRPGSEFVELELLPFDEGQRREFLGRWFQREGCAAEKRPNVEAVMEVLQGESGLWELSGNPLYLTLMALLFEQGKEPRRNRADLYDQVFDLLLAGRHRPAGQAIAAQKAVRALLRQLAFDMTRDNRDGEPRTEIEARLYQDEYNSLRKPLEKVPAWRRTLGPFLTELAEKVGILGPHDGPRAEWRYWHRTFREALAAEQLAAQLKDGGDDAILKQAAGLAGDESRWAEPYALLVSQVQNPDVLVSSLVEANRALGLRAVATAQRLSDETLRKVLQLTDDPQERSKVYGEIPDLIDEPERALALVGQLGQRTRNGNDLFFLGETIRTIVKRWPDASHLADAAHARLFEHIPAPPEELFRWIETRDGRVELWREIPAEEGWVGAADGEEEYEDERPRHRVKITRAFSIAAVPITNAQYEAFDPGKAPCAWVGVPHENLALHPRVNVTWYEAVSFCRWLSRHVPGARLPREEEWEVACRAGTDTLYWSGETDEDLSRVGWYKDNSEGRAHRVGRLEANPWGLHDLHGNVWEWMATEWGTARYQGRSEEPPFLIDPTKEPADLAGPPRDRRVVRGGSYGFTALGCRSACRSTYGDSWDPWDDVLDRGFRVLLSCAPSWS